VARPAADHRAAVGVVDPVRQRIEVLEVEERRRVVEAAVDRLDAGGVALEAAQDDLYTVGADGSGVRRLTSAPQ
jgi:hypothetical protein